jgi:hypothetical protein
MPASTVCIFVAYADLLLAQRLPEKIWNSIAASIIYTIGNSSRNDNHGFPLIGGGGT